MLSQSRNLEEIEGRSRISRWLALSRPKKHFHAAVSVLKLKQHVFSHKIVFQRKILLAGISRRQNFPEHTLKFREADRNKARSVFRVKRMRACQRMY